MDFKTGMIILGEFALLGALIWGAVHEAALIEAEKKAAERARRLIRMIAIKHEANRRAKIEKRALYTPVKPPLRNTKKKAA